MSTKPPLPLTSDEQSRLEDLLADRAVFGLDAEESAELSELLNKSQQADDPTFDNLAANLTIGMLAGPASEPLPPTLREQLLDDAAEFDFEASTPTATSPTPSEGAATRDPLGPVRRLEWPLYTMAAIAAGLLVSFYINKPTEPPLPDQRVALIAEADDLVQVSWAPQEDASLDKLEGDGAYGDVVWSDSAQSGYMRFRGLKANDPNIEQYQLWVFDEARNADHPVDGGVFDIPAGLADGEVIIPIDAKLSITKATLFAITVEKPGGVVVSDRSRLPLLAARQEG